MIIFKGFWIQVKVYLFLAYTAGTLTLGFWGGWKVANNPVIEQTQNASELVDKVRFWEDGR